MHLEQFLRRLGDFAASPDGRFGCLMCQTTSEVSPHIRSVAGIVSDYLNELRVLFRRACLNARQRSEIRRGSDVDQMADYPGGAVLGLMALARSPAPRTAVARSVDGVVGFLRSLQPKREGDTLWGPAGPARSRDRTGRV